MNRRHWISGWLLALIALLSSLSAIAAPQKQFSIGVLPGLATPGATAFTVTIKNETPNGNSNINSLVVTLPLGFTISTPPVPATAWGSQLTWTAGSPGTAPTITLQNMSPLKPQQSLQITVTANVPAPSSTTACPTYTWSAVAWTGSSLSGDTFLPIASTAGAGTATTAIATGLSMSFGSLPTSVVANPPNTTPYAIPVVLSNACSLPVPPTSVTVSANNSITGGGTQTTSNGSTTFSLSFSNVGQTTLTASAPGYTSVSVTFSVFGGTLNCAPTPPFTFDASTTGAGVNDSGYASGSRGKYNKDGLTCLPVNYTFTNNIFSAVDPSVTLHWDTLLQPGAAYMYSVNWQPVIINSADTNMGFPPPQRPKLTWQFDASGNPINKRLGIACLSAKLPAPYGRLASANVVADSGTVTLDTSNPPVEGWATAPVTAAFPIMIGAERMQATPMGGGTYSVQRHQGGTSPVNVGDFVGKFVMSTPLPIDGNARLADNMTTNPTQNQVAQMCIMEQGWMNTTPDPTTGAARAMFFTTVFDIGDGWVNPN